MNKLKLELSDQWRSLRVKSGKEVIYRLNGESFYVLKELSKFKGNSVLETILDHLQGEGVMGMNQSFNYNENFEDMVLSYDEEVEEELGGDALLNLEGWANQQSK